MMRGIDFLSSPTRLEKEPGGQRSKIWRQSTTAGGGPSEQSDLSRVEIAGSGDRQQGERPRGPCGCFEIRGGFRGCFGRSRRDQATEHELDDRLVLLVDESPAKRGGRRLSKRLRGTNREFFDAPSLRCGGGIEDRFQQGEIFARFGFAHRPDHGRSMAESDGRESPPALVGTGA